MSNSIDVDPTCMPVHTFTIVFFINEIPCYASVCLTEVEINIQNHFGMIKCFVTYQ